MEVADSVLLLQVSSSTLHQETEVTGLGPLCWKLLTRAGFHRYPWLWPVPTVDVGSDPVTQSSLAQLFSLSSHTVAPVPARSLVLFRSFVSQCLSPALAEVAGLDLLLQMFLT